ncbi:MAG: hypothetical protein E7491_09165 [Ruminococcaceae bacterium]|nr:hypothetical protein [Oscillospiraceae bacterium]
MASLLEYKCPACGGAMAFDSASQKVKCPFCDSVYDMEQFKPKDEVLEQEIKEKAPADDGWQEGETDSLRAYVCQSCGGEIVSDATTAATSCPYCDNPVVIKQQFSGMLKPKYVIPFKYDKEHAKKALKRHFEGKKLLPKVFKDENHIDEVKGVYVPVWLFNAKMKANIKYKATRVRSWSDSRYNYTETSFFAIDRGGSIGFERVPVDGSSKMPDDLMESVEPYNFKDAVDFQTAYLAGYFADKYDIDDVVSMQRAAARMKKSAEDAFKKTVTGYATVMTESSDVSATENEASYALYPVWILNTTWQGKKYLFAMNGQTGKLVGNLPMDKGAYFRWLFGIAGIVTAVCVGLSLLLHIM